jgi:hypothetical protein
MTTKYRLSDEFSSHTFEADTPEAAAQQWADLFDWDFDGDGLPDEAAPPTDGQIYEGGNLIAYFTDDHGSVTITPA